MNDYRPSVRTLIMMLASFFAVVLPAIWFATMGYMWGIEHGLKLDTDAKPEDMLDRLLILLVVLPMIPLLVAAVFIASIPWMFLMSRLLSWTDIQYFTEQKGPRLPVLSSWLDRLWLYMIKSRRPESSTGGASQ